MKQCPLCGKGTIMGGKRNLLRGKYNPTKTVRKYPNLQWASLAARGKGDSDAVRGRSKRIKLCTSCIKKGDYLKPSVAKKLAKA